MQIFAGVPLGGASNYIGGCRQRQFLAIVQYSTDYMLTLDAGNWRSQNRCEMIRWIWVYTERKKNEKKQNGLYCMTMKID